MTQFVRANLLVAGVFVFGISPVAALTITVSPTPIIAGLNPTSWSYGVTLEGNSQITNGDFFTIFDFAGFNGITNNPAGWSFASSNVGTCPTDAGFPALCSLADNPTIPNLTWTRTGGTIVGPGAGAAVPLGNFIAQSMFITPINDFWVSQDDDLQTGTANEGAAGNTNVPFGVPVTVPDQATSRLLLAIGLLAVARARRRFAK